MIWKVKDVSYILGFGLQIKLMLALFHVLLNYVFFILIPL